MSGADPAAIEAAIIETHPEIRPSLKLFDADTLRAVMALFASVPESAAGEATGGRSAYLDCCSAEEW